MDNKFEWTDELVKEFINFYNSTKVYVIGSDPISKKID